MATDQAGPEPNIQAGPATPLVAASPIASISDAIASSHTPFQLRQPLQYAGERDMVKLQSWFQSMETYFKLTSCPEALLSLYASTFLVATARAWYTAWHKEYEQQSLEAGTASIRPGAAETIIPSIEPSWEDLKTGLQEYFQPPNFEEVILREFSNLRQTGSVHDYTNQFTDILLQIPLKFKNDRVYLLYRYIDGLQQDIRCHLRLTNPQSITQAQSMADSCESVLRSSKAWFMPRNATTSDSHPRAQFPTRTPRQITARPDNSRQQQRRHLAPEELQRRNRNNLCRYCGEAGHIANDCPAKVSPRRMATDDRGRN